MASQEMTYKEVLIETAKDLGAKYTHLMGEKKLKETIIALGGEVPSETQEVVTTQEVVKEVVTPEKIVPKPETNEVRRKFAPKMSVSSIGQDSRSRRVEQLQKDNPGWKYIYQSSGMTTEQLNAKGLESTGEYMKNDLICRTDMDSYNAWTAAKRDANRKTMNSIDVSGSMIKSHTENAKTPKDKE